MKNIKPKLGSKEYLRIYQESLLQHTFLLNDLNNDLPKVTDGQSVIFSMLINSIIESCQSILFLSENRKLRDCMALSRMVLDLSLNLGYFSVKGQSAIDKAQKHAHQKSYRDLHRTFEIKDIKFFIGLEDSSKIKMNKKLKEAITDFTSSKGKENRAWTGDPKDNVFKKLELITEKFGTGIGTAMAMATFKIYRHGSEIIHGTLFGSMYALGLTEIRSEWPKDDNSRIKYINSELSLLLHVLSLLCNCVISIVLEGYPNSKVKEKMIELSLKLEKGE